MSEFEKRGASFESKFAHDEALKFKAEARRNKLLALWAADLMGMTEAEANGYVAEVIKSDFEEAGDEDVFRKVRADLDAKNVEKSDHQLRRTMDELMATAIEQLEKEG